MSNSDLKAIIAKHGLWLRNEEGGERADLSGASLREADLSVADLSGASLSGADLRPDVPRIPNIDAAILAAIEGGGTLDMSAWHTCETTHCRAGWAITLAGAAGARLEKEYGTNAAAALIYAVSRPDRPVPNWYASADEVMAELRTKGTANG